MRMNIVGWDPFRDLSELQQGINQTFDTWRGGAQPGAARSWQPRCDVCEKEGEIQVVLEVPGLSLDDINIEVTAENLTISGERKQEEQEGAQWVRVERQYGPFSRSFAIGIPIEVQGVKASYRNGLLMVSIPKSEDIKPKRISIEAE